VENPAGHAFISYVHEDWHEVDRLQEALEAAGIAVWRDTDDLWPGEDWRRKIRRAITDNALVFIACFSSHSAARVRTFQNEELLLAIEQLRLRRPDDPWLIPVRFDDCKIPDFDLGGGRTLASIQRADLFGDRRTTGIQRLVKAILRLLDQQPREGKRAKRETEWRDVVLDPERWGGGGLAPGSALYSILRQPAAPKRNVAERAREEKVVFSIESQGERIETTSEAEALEFLKQNPLVVSGQTSRVLELDLPRGRYRVSWTGKGQGVFAITHQTTRGEGGSTFGGGRVPNPGHGEHFLRIDQGGRHIFSVSGGSRMTWEVTFTPL
jgi:hypothetical protein